MINDRHCYELYGFDILIDNDLRSWLLEVNASPSLSAETQEDYDRKFNMLDDMLEVIESEKKSVSSLFRLSLSFVCLLIKAGFHFLEIRNRRMRILSSIFVPFIYVISVRSSCCPMVFHVLFHLWYCRVIEVDLFPKGLEVSIFWSKRGKLYVRRRIV